MTVERQMNYALLGRGRINEAGPGFDVLIMQHDAGSYTPSWRSMQALGRHSGAVYSTAKGIGDNRPAQHLRTQGSPDNNTASQAYCCRQPQAESNLSLGAWNKPQNDEFVHVCPPPVYVSVSRFTSYFTRNCDSVKSIV